jgi:hypothetical protein
MPPPPTAPGQGILNHLNTDQTGFIPLRQTLTKLGAQLGLFALWGLRGGGCSPAGYIGCTEALNSYEGQA